MSEFVSQLRSGNDKMQILRSFHHWISSSETSAVVKLATDENFASLFDFLYQAAPEEIMLASEILHKMISVVPTSSRIPRLRQNLLRGLEHSSAKIREVVLKELKICAQDNSTLEHLSGNEDFVIRIARLVGDDSLTVATASCDFLVLLGCHSETGILILSPPVGEVLKNVLSVNDTLKFRVYEVVMKIATSSDENLHLVAKNGYFEILNSDVKSKDDLLVLNCLEVVKDLAITNHGLKYLNDVGFIKAASDMIFTSMEPPESFIILPGLLKFFISIGQFQPEYVFHQHNSVVQAMFNLLDSSDVVLMCIATDGIGLLGSTVHGKNLLQNEGKMPCALQSFRSNLQQGSSPELKFHVIQALSRLLEVSENERNVNLENVLEGWLKDVSDDLGNLLFQLCRQPFLEIRQSALYLMYVVVSHEWGQRSMVSVPGFVEFLLDRSTEGTVNGKELKFKVVSALVNSSSFERIFDVDTVAKMKEYHRQGPFYVMAQSAVAVDEPL